MERIETFERGDKQILFFNLSDIQSNAELSEVVDKAKETIKGFPYHSLYTITNISRIVFDTKTKEIAADWMVFNKPYVIGAAIIGATGMRKIMVNMVLTLSSRTNSKLFNDKEQALDWFNSLS